MAYDESRKNERPTNEQMLGLRGILDRDVISQTSSEITPKPLTPRNDLKKENSHKAYRQDISVSKTHNFISKEALPSLDSFVKENPRKRPLRNPTIPSSFSTELRAFQSNQERLSQLAAELDVRSHESKIQGANNHKTWSELQSEIEFCRASFDLATVREKNRLNKEKRENTLDKQAKTLDQLEDSLQKWEDTLNNIETHLADREGRASNHENLLVERERLVDKREKYFEEKDETLIGKNKAFDRHQRSLSNREDCLNVREKHIDKREGYLNSLIQQFEDRVAQMNKQEMKLLAIQERNSAQIKELKSFIVDKTKTPNNTAIRELLDQIRSIMEPSDIESPSEVQENGQEGLLLQETTVNPYTIQPSPVTEHFIPSQLEAISEESESSDLISPSGSQFLTVPSSPAYPQNVHFQCQNPFDDMKPSPEAPQSMQNGKQVVLSPMDEWSKSVVSIESTGSSRTSILPRPRSEGSLRQRRMGDVRHSFPPPRLEGLCDPFLDPSTPREPYSPQEDYSQMMHIHPALRPLAPSPPEISSPMMHIHPALRPVTSSSTEPSSPMTYIHPAPRPLAPKMSDPFIDNRSIPATTSLSPVTPQTVSTPTTDIVIHNIQSEGLAENTVELPKQDPKRVSISRRASSKRSDTRGFKKLFTRVFRSKARSKSEYPKVRPISKAQTLRRSLSERRVASSTFNPLTNIIEHNLEDPQAIGRQIFGPDASSLLTSTPPKTVQRRRIPALSPNPSSQDIAEVSRPESSKATSSRPSSRPSSSRPTTSRTSSKGRTTPVNLGPNTSRVRAVGKQKEVNAVNIGRDWMEFD
ncbi:MAG: hypothetical protein M1834_009592 [Cirrosporium novae-zelandiae]|nr:MAG: hypothetical protein M1834_009592 [Cirrosporium novae-zelandiae]